MTVSKITTAIAALVLSVTLANSAEQSVFRMQLPGVILSSSPPIGTNNPTTHSCPIWDLTTGLQTGTAVVPVAEPCDPQPTHQCQTWDAQLQPSGYQTVPLSQACQPEPVIPLILASSHTVEATVGNFLTYSLPISGGRGDYEFSITSGSVPPGITFDDGVFSGTPTAATSTPATVVISATDDSTPLQVASTTVTIAVATPLTAAGYQSFENPGTYTFTAPKYPFTVKVALIGGGYAGSTTGPGSRGYALVVNQVTINGPTTVTVGAGGTNVTTTCLDGNRTSPTPSSFGLDSTTSGVSYFIAIGGFTTTTFSAGSQGSTNTGGLGGLGGYLSSNSGTASGTRAEATTQAGSSVSVGGFGGTGFGAGGGACTTNSTYKNPKKGGAGAKGLVYVEWAAQ